ncbi:MAG TPA: M48 family metallopeptidase [Chryseolinea sp.]
MESTFSIDDFLASGSVLFNDAVSVYLDEVLKEILKTQPDLKKKVRVYAVKSASVNAFTTNSGLIFVNLGLLSRLDNEAQLAFVLSHEVVHYQKKHVINAYVTNIDIEQGRGDYRKLSVSEKGFAKSTYSKEKESEADLSGAAIYQKSDYAKDSVENIFDILKMADHPLSWGAFPKDRFESGRYVFPDSFTTIDVKPFAVDEDYDDSSSSHPNIKKRREAVRDKFKGISGGVDFRISETRFQSIRKIARYELCRQFLLEHRYAESLALATSLQGENPGSSYLRETVAKACYGLARQGLKDEVNLDEEEWVGEAVRIFNFVKQQSDYELSVLALRQLARCQEATPNNAEISLMTKDLIKAFSEKHDSLTLNFVRLANGQPIDHLKYPYTQYAFADLKNPAAFFDVLDKNVVPTKKVDTRPKTKKERKEQRKLEAEREKVLAKQRRKEKRKPLNVNKVVVVNPLYKKIDKRKSQRVRHVEAEKVLIAIDEKINDAAGKLGMATEIINPNTITNTQVSQMQSNSVLSDWIDEQMRSRDKTISPIYNEMVALADKHKTDHFMWMGGISVKTKRYLKGFYIGTAIIVPTLTPWCAYYVFTADAATLYFALVFNVRTQELELLDVRPMAMKDNGALLQSNIYYTLFNLKN